MIPKDKLLHIIAGAGIAAWMTVLFHFLPVASSQQVIWLTVMSSAVAKEVRDWYNHGDYTYKLVDFDLMDIVATMAGGSVGMVL